MIRTIPATSRLTLVDPITDGRWDDFVLGHPQGMVFHRAAWARVLVDSYGYQPRYHALENDRGEIEAAWPAILIRSRITGRRLVTLPFSDHCPPLVRDAAEAAVLFDGLQKHSESVGAKRIEVRGWPWRLPAPEALASVHGYVCHVIDLRSGGEAVFRKVATNARRSIRRAEKLGVTTRLAPSRSDLDTFVGLNLKLRRRHGMLPQPKRFFEAIHRHLIEPGLAYILLAERRGLPLAGVLCLRHNRVTLDKYAVNDGELREYRGSHLVMWRAIQMEIARGAAWYDMGRSDATARSLHWFKEQWGAEARDAPYLYYPRPGGLSTSDPRGSKKAALALFARLAPNPLYRAAGSLIYGHLG